MEEKENNKEQNKIRKVFLEDLPRFGNSNRISWKNSVGYKVNFIYDSIEGEIEIVNYNRPYISIQYLDKPEYIIFYGDLLECKLGRLLGKYNGDFRVEIGQTFKDKKRDLIITDREHRKDKNGQNRKWYKYACNKCGWTEGWVEEHCLLNKDIGCSCCYGFTVVEGINDIPTTAPWMVKYFQGGYDEAKLYTKTSNKRVYPICPDCKRIKKKLSSIANIYEQHTIGCPCSSDGVSYPEKFMYSVLEQLSIEFVTEYSPNWIKPKRYDFYIPSLNLIIEMDGGLHFKDNFMSGQTKEKSLEIDNYKDKIAKKYGIEVIRIDCTNIKNREISFKYTKQNILKSRLNALFDLNNIDWLKCEEFALSNLVKKACDLWNSGIESTKEIGKIMRRDSSTINRYLIKGVGLGWCSYNPKLSYKKHLDSIRYLKRDKVAVFKDGILLGIYESLSDLEKQSKDKYGINLDRHYIALVCKGRRKEYHGFTFKYVDKDITTTNIQQSA